MEMESNDAIGAIPKICKAMDGLDSFGGHSDPHGDLVLALFAAKRLVELHGGTIGTDPRRGQGGVLLVTLPKSKEASRDSLLVGSGADQHSAGSA